MTHDELRSLLGVYAINAVDADESRIVTTHLAECPQCRAEVTELREVAALLGNSSATAPDGLWDRIASSLEEPPPPLRLEVGPRRRPARRRLVYLAAISAAAVLVAVLALNVRRLNSDVDQLERARRESNELALAAEHALTEPGARVARLTGSTQLNALAVVRSNGQGYFLGSSLPPPDNGIYELWGATANGQVVALGTMAQPGTYAFSADPSITVVMITSERSPVSSPTGEPIVAGTLT